MKKIKIDSCRWVMGGTGIGVLSFLEMTANPLGRYYVRRIILIGLFKKCLRITINISI
jgi:hypothetical protein